MRTVSFNGLCWVDVILAWSANGKMWVCGFHGRIKEYTYWKQLERLKSILIDLPTYIVTRVLVLFHCISTCSFLQKISLHRDFVPLWSNLKKNIHFYLIFFFYKIQYYRVGQISVDSLNKFIKGKKMNLPSK